MDARMKVLEPTMARFVNPGRHDEQPSHLLLVPGDRKAICGEPDPLPHVWVKYASAHVQGHNMPICQACRDEFRGHYIDDPAQLQLL